MAGGENCCEVVCIDSDLKVSSLGCYCEYHGECFTDVKSCCANTCVNGSSCVGFSCNELKGLQNVHMARPAAATT